MPRSVVRFLATLVLVIVVVVGWSAASIVAGSRSSQTGPADAAVVLGAAVWGDQPSPVFRERIHHAIDLYRTGTVDRILFTGGAAGDGQLAEAVVAQRYAVAQGVPGEDILIETSSRTTLQNLQGAKQVFTERGLQTFMLVSDPLHMTRATLIASDLGLDARPSPTPTTRYRTVKTQLGFLAREIYFYLAYNLHRQAPDAVPYW